MRRQTSIPPSLAAADTVPDLRQRVTRQQRLEAEEVAVERGREDQLVDDDLDGYRQGVGPVVEVPRQPDEPVRC